jgi:uncharacterized protein involved in exopolysaccharide biosynthesis
MVVHGPEHPQVKQLDQQIRDATQQLSETMETIMQSQVESANPVKAELAQSLAEAEALRRNRPDRYVECAMAANMIAKNQAPVGVVVRRVRET